ncbi:hypothetical protein AB9K41_17765 [Cribrihabitans sp. XS_ASV171]
MLFSFGSLLSIISLFCGVVGGLFFGSKKNWRGIMLLIIGLGASAFIGFIDQDQRAKQIQTAEARARESQEREAQLQRDVSDLAKRLDASRADLADVSIALENSRAREERLEGSVESLEKSLLESRDREIRFGEDNKRFRADNLRLLDDLAAAQGQISELLEKVDAGNAESAVIRQTVESQRIAQQQSEIRRMQEEHCADIYQEKPDGFTILGSQDPNIVGDGRCERGQYFGPDEKSPWCMNC